MNKLFSLLMFSFLLIWGSTSFAQTEAKEKHVNTGFIDLNGYYDTREFTVFTINLLANLPNRFQYFSLTNYQGPTNSSDVSTFYSEHNLRWKIKPTLPLSLTYQYVTRQGPQNDDHRFGLLWRVHNTPMFADFFKKINLKLSTNPMFLQYRVKAEPAYMTTIEHVYFLKLMPKTFKGRVYVLGFADQNFVYNDNGKLSFEWVSEHQLGIRLVDQLFAVGEYRINTYLGDGATGFGYGLQYKVNL